MPNRLLNEKETIKSILDWIEQNMDINHRINAICSDVSKIPEKKGIYLFFTKTKILNNLSEILKIDIQDFNYTIELEDEKYHLVYIGSAGTGKNGGGTLKSRLEWHLCMKHDKNTVCHGTLSSFRSGLSALMAEDIILNYTESKVNDLLKDGFQIFYIPYDNANLIASDELTLIKIIRPLFNIKNNPNALLSSIDNPTRRYRERRSRIIENTRIRLGQLDSVNYSNKKEPDIGSIYEHQVITEEKGCKSFSVAFGQRIDKVVRGIEGLPTGLCRFRIFDSSNPEIGVYVTKRNDGWRETGRNKGQNFYTYFSNVDTTKDNLPRWEVIQKEMKKNNINEIVIVVCEVSSNKVHNSGEGTQIDQKETLKHETSIETKLEEPKNIIKSEKRILIIIPCCKSKQNGGIKRPNIYTPLEDITAFHALCNQRNDIVNNYIFRDDELYMKAIDRYDNILYKGLRKNYHMIETLINNNSLDIVIVSALYGLINLETYIRNYDLTMRESKIWYQNNILEQALSTYIEKGEYTHVFSFLSPTSGYCEAAWHNNYHHNNRLWPNGLGSNPYGTILNVIIEIIKKIYNQFNNN